MSIAAEPTDGRALLRGFMVPLITPMSAPGKPATRHVQTLLDLLAEAGADGLMLLGSNGEGPLLLPGDTGDFVDVATQRWRDIRPGGSVVVNVTGSGTAETLARVEAVARCQPDALVLSPPTYFHHRPDEVLAAYAALEGAPAPVVAYNNPRYTTPMSPEIVDGLLDMPHVVGLKDSSGDLELFRYVVGAASPRGNFGVSQGAEHQMLAGLKAGADGVVPGIGNLAPKLVTALLRAHAAGRGADRLQDLANQLMTLHQIRPGVPAVKAILAARGVCDVHCAPPLVPCSADERDRLLDHVQPFEEWLVGQPLASQPEEAVMST